MREIININRKWSFRKGSGPIKSIPVDWDFVNLPHSWNAIDGQDGDNDYYRGVCCYAKVISKSDFPEAECYYLEFRGANSVADVYANGKKLFHHEGGYSTFRVEITEEFGENTLIVVTVDNSEKGTVYPQMADFTFYGGLYRDVNLIAVSESHFDLDYYGSCGVTVTPVIKGENADIETEAFVTKGRASQNIVYTVKDAEGKVVGQRETAVDEKTVITIEDVKLWQGRKNPYLYTLEAVLVEYGKTVDKVIVRFGCRSFEIDSEKGFILNGEEYPLRGVSRHQDRWGVGNALLPEHHIEDIDLICETGATAVRLAHYQHDQYFYDLCDEKGLVVWAEIPYISKHMPEARENTLSQMKELVIQNYNHPSVVVWGLSNEITMNGSGADLIENHKILNTLCHDTDRIRLTAIACVSMCDINDPYVQIPDAVSYNHYFGWYGGETSMNGPWFDNFHRAFPHIPIGISEYGCEALDWHTSEPVQGDYTEEYQAYYHEELIKQIEARPYLWSTFVWNMFDFGADARNEGGENGQNHKGLVTFDRKYKKDSFYAYKAWLSDEPFVHICGKRYIDRAEDITKVTVYSNLPEVELFVNGKSFEKKKGDKFFYFSVPNKGETHLIAKAQTYTDESHIRKVDTFNEKYRLREKGAVLNWFDITEEEGYLSLNSKMNDILNTEEGKSLFASVMSQAGADTAKGAAAFEMNESMMQMMGGFTALRLISLLGMTGFKMTKEQLLSFNAQLNRIKKP